MIKGLELINYLTKDCEKCMPQDLNAKFCWFSFSRGHYKGYLLRSDISLLKVYVHINTNNEFHFEHKNLNGNE